MGSNVRLNSASSGSCPAFATHFLKALAAVVLSNYWFRVHDRKYASWSQRAAEGGCGAAGRRALLACCHEDQKPEILAWAERHQGPVGGDGHLHDPLPGV